jgi:hypothetical protein
VRDVRIVESLAAIDLGLDVKGPWESELLETVQDGNKGSRCFRIFVHGVLWSCELGRRFVMLRYRSQPGTGKGQVPDHMSTPRCAKTADEVVAIMPDQYTRLAPGPKGHRAEGDGFF